MWFQILFLIRYLFHYVLSYTPYPHLEHNLPVSLLLSCCSTGTNDYSWRNWCSGNGYWSYITDCRPTCLQHCVLQTRDLLASCRIRHVYHICTVGCLCILEKKCNRSQIWLLHGKSASSWPFSKEGSKWHHRTLGKEKTVTQFSRRESYVHVLLKLLCWFKEYKLRMLLSLITNFRPHDGLQHSKRLFTIDISPFSTCLIPKCRDSLPNWRGTTVPYETTPVMLLKNSLN